jgi:OFA family oxalate/formate antiporter-like MFS transporter
MESPNRVPARAWVVTFAGMAVNLCLGILYAWSVWKNRLAPPTGASPGMTMSGPDEGWVYLSSADATWAYSICGCVFALCMIPGGRLQDRYGPKLGATLGGLSLAAGCILSGILKSFVGLILGFGLLGGIGMGLAYAATTPAAVKWFGPHRRGLIVGIVVAGYGGASIYISPLANFLMEREGLSGSFVGLGIFFAFVVVVAGQLLTNPPAGYVPPMPAGLTPTSAPTRTDWKPTEMLGTWQFFVLVFLFFGTAQSGLLVINNAAPMLSRSARAIAFFAANAWILSSYSGVINATGRIGTGLYSDRLGRANAFTVNSLISAACLFAIPSIMRSGDVTLLFVTVGITIWQYGGGLSLLPAWTADYYGPKNLGANYGLVFLGWGMAFLVPLLAGYIEDRYGGLDYAFYLSGAILLVALLVSRVVTKPIKREAS